MVQPSDWFSAMRLAWAGGHYHVLSLAPEVYSIDYVPFARA